MPDDMTSVLLTSEEVTIPASDSLSEAIDLGGRTLVGIHMPSSWVDAPLSYQVSDNGSRYSNFHDEFGNEIVTAVGASRYVRMEPSAWIGVRHLRVRSGAAGAPVDQATDQTLKLILRAF